MHKPIRVLVTGANGQVGHELLRALAERPIPLVALRARSHQLRPSQAKGEGITLLEVHGKGATLFGTKGVDAQHRGDVRLLASTCSTGVVP